MARANSDSRPRKYHEWVKGRMDNVGVTTPIPVSELWHYLNKRNVIRTVDCFFDKKLKSVTYFDVCGIQQYWWVRSTISHARYCQIEHPVHYAGEYIFDEVKLNLRTVIEIRQPDLDGKHWKASHVHIKRGTIKQNSDHEILKIIYNEHIPIMALPFQGNYAMKIGNNPTTTPDLRSKE